MKGRVALGTAEGPQAEKKTESRDDMENLALQAGSPYETC